MKNPGIEAKPAYATFAVFAVQTLFAAAGYYHWFTPPPPALTVAITTVAAGVAGWVAPHTSRPKPITTLNDLVAAAHDVGAEIVVEHPPAVKAPPAARSKP